CHLYTDAVLLFALLLVLFVLPSHRFVSTLLRRFVLFLFFFNDPATTEIYTLSLHDALPILGALVDGLGCFPLDNEAYPPLSHCQDRKSTRLNSSHVSISYAVFCLKKKKKKKKQMTTE